MHISVNLLTICLWIMVSLTESNSAQTEFPEQQECLTQTSILFDAKLIPQLAKEWYVARATLRTLLPKDLPEPTINNCTPMTYFGGCQGAIYIERTWSPDGSVKKMTKAYSKQYDNIAEYWEDQKRMDPNYFVWLSTGKSMTLHFRDGTYQEIPLSEVPVIKNVLARVSTLVVYGYVTDTGKVDWMLYLDCDEDIAWIEIAKYVYDDKELLDDVNHDIDEYLQDPDNLLLVPQMIYLKTVEMFYALLMKNTHRYK